MKSNCVLLLVLLLCALLAGCTQSPQSTPIPQASETPAAPATLELQLPTSTPFVITATPAAVLMLSGDIAFETFSLRTGPGVLFPRVNIYWSGTEILVWGREAGNNWVLVQVPADQRTGWMKAVGLNIEGDLNSLPIYQVDNTQVIHGYVYLSDGITPATGIGISIAPNVNDLSASSDNCVSNVDGEWYLYLPTDIQGAYRVGPNSYACEGSNAVTPTADGSCSLLGTLPGAVEVGLPYSGAAIDFTILPLP